MFWGCIQVVYLQWSFFFFYFTVFTKIFSTGGIFFFFLTISYQKRKPDRSIEFELINLSPAYKKGLVHLWNYKAFQATPWIHFVLWVTSEK